MNETADAWARATALLLILNGISFALAAFPILIFGLLIPSSIAESLPPELQEFTAVFALMSFILYLIFGALSVFLGLGIWNNKPWARIITIILGWLGIPLGLVLILIAFVPSEYPAVYSISIGITGLILAVLSVIQVRYFHYHEEIKANFKKPVSGFRLELKPARQIVKAWAIMLGIPAVLLLLSGILLIFLGPAMAPEDIEGMSSVMVMAGLFVALLGGVSLFVSYGLWEVRPWARTLTLVMTWLTIILLPVYAALTVWAQGSYFDLINVVLQAGLYAGIQLYVFQFSPVKDAFRASKR
jgi:hypothetical protein